MRLVKNAVLLLLLGLQEQAGIFSRQCLQDLEGLAGPENTSSMIRRLWQDAHRQIWQLLSPESV